MNPKLTERTETPCALALLAAGLLLLLVPNLPGQTTPFTLATRTVQIPESGDITCTVLRGPECEFMFRPPLDWRPQPDLDHGTITWTSPDYTSTLRIRIKLSGGGQPIQPRPEELRQVVLQELPAAHITDEFNCPTGGPTGQAVDLEYVVEDRFPFSARAAFIPCPGGRAEIRLTVPRDQFPQAQIEWAGFLNSFHVEPVKPH